MKDLILNRWMTPDGTILTSTHTHDYVSHTDKNGEYYFVDGGCSYIRMSENKEKMKDMCLHYDSPFEEIRQCIKRGTFDSEGNRVWIPLCNMSDEHVLNCITYNVKYFGENVGPHTVLYMKELVYRHENGLRVSERTYTKDDETPKPEYTENAEISQNGIFEGECREGFTTLMEMTSENNLNEGDATSTYVISILRKCISKFEESGNTEYDKGE